MNDAPRIDTLPDGARLQVRPVHPDDRERYLAAFAHLSPRSRYTRFLSPMDHLSTAEVDYFLDVDHHDHEALIAMEARSGTPVGIGRYVRDQEHPERAEIAVTVDDEWQGRGVGRVLLHALAELARGRAITTFTAEMLSANLAMRGLFDTLEAVAYVEAGDGVVHAEGRLPGPA